MLGHAEEWFFRGLGGINVDLSAKEPRQLVLRPQPVGKLTSVQTRYESALGPVESGERMYDHARHHHVLRGGQSRALPADLAARRLAAVEWGRQQQVETLEEGRGA